MLTGEALGAGTRQREIARKLTPACVGCHGSVAESLAEIVAALISKEAGTRATFYEKHARPLADIFSEVSGINVIDDSAAIIISLRPPGQAEQQSEAAKVIEKARALRNRSDE